MHKKPPQQIEQTTKPSKLLMGASLVIALSLPYLLVKNFSHRDHPRLALTQHNLTLPEPEKKTALTPKNNQELTNALTQAITDKRDTSTQPIVAVTKVPAVPKMTIKAPVVKAPVQNTGWQTIKPKVGDSMASLFHRLGLSAQNLHLVVHKNPYAKTIASIKPSQELQFFIQNKKLEKLIIPINDIQTLTIYKDGAVYRNQVDSKKVTNQDKYLTGVVQGSLYTTAKRLGIPSKLISQMTTILSKQVDFSHEVRSGDRFSIVYEAQYVKDKMVGIGDVVAVTYTHQNKVAQAIRHISANGTRDYYSAQGQSFKKAFSRYPIRFSHISSTFSNSRYHPILHYRRSHKGVDLAAPIGTPIRATGDGVIHTIGRHNGYGNMIKISHDKTYSTVYGHMLRFQKGLYRGSRVKRDQIIGYVGQTGLATGPHCHFELHVNNEPRNPSTTYLPTANSVPAREMAAFKNRSHLLFSRLKLFEEATYARKQTKKKVG